MRKEITQLPQQRTLPAELLLYTGNDRMAVGRSTGGIFYHWSLNFTLDGGADWQFGDFQFETTRGDLLIVQPDYWAWWKVPERYGGWHTTYAVFQHRTHWLEWLNKWEFRNGVARLHIDDEAVFARLRRGMAMVDRLHRQADEHGDLWGLAALERVLLTLDTHDLQGEGFRHPRVREAIKFIRAHYAEPLTLRRIAAAVYVSPGYLSLLFMEQMKMTPIQYLEKIRLTRAAELLRFSDFTIGEVAGATGYRDTRYFARRFGLQNDCSPSAYRRRFRAGVP